MSISTSDAINSLKPGAKYVLRGETLEWKDSSQTEPTTSQITTEKARLQAIEDYQKPRRQQYPPIGDQLDDLFRQGAFSSDMAAKIQKVKSDNPKP